MPSKLNKVQFLLDDEYYLKLIEFSHDKDRTLSKISSIAIKQFLDNYKQNDKKKGTI